MQQPNSTDLKNAAQDAGKFASDKAKQVANKAENVIDRNSSLIEQGERKAGELYDQATEAYGMARERAVDVYDTSADFVKRYPLYTVAGAVAVGFVAAMILRRRN